VEWLIDVLRLGEWPASTLGIAAVFFWQIKQLRDDLREERKDYQTLLQKCLDRETNTSQS
jgi:hypothetical protein